MPESFIPDNEDELVTWFNDHAAGVATHGAMVGLTAGEIAQPAVDAQTVAHAVNARALYQSKSQEVTEYKNSLLYSALNTPVPGTPTAPAIGALPMGAIGNCVARARLRAQQVKGHVGYTAAIGEDMRIVAPAAGGPVMQPTLEASPETDYAIRLTFAMNGHQQIEIWEKRGAAVDFTMLAVDSNNPYVDGRAPLVVATPETRQYRARYRDDDAPVGTWSDVISVVAQG